MGWRSGIDAVFERFALGRRKHKSRAERRHILDLDYDARRFLDQPPEARELVERHRTTMERRPRSFTRKQWLRRRARLRMARESRRRNR